jgi:hypothetical protein
MRTVFLSLTALAFLATPARLPAELRFDPPGADLGEVRAGQVFQEEVRVTNAGTTPVQIAEIKSSCGCLRVRMQPDLLQPGQTGTLTMQINTLSAAPGVQGWRVRLRTHQGEQAEFLLRAEVRQEIVVTPAALTLYGDKPSTHLLTVTDRRTRPLRLLGVTTTVPQLKAVILAPDKVEVQVQSGFPEGRSEEEVILTTDDPQYPELRFLVKVVKRSQARFTALPKEVELHRSEHAPLLSRVVTLRDAQGQPLTVDRIETSHPALTAVVVSRQRGSTMLRIGLEGQTLGQNPFTGVVTVTFRGTTERLTIPVRCP